MFIERVSAIFADSSGVPHAADVCDRYGVGRV
jgi:hypothetical protein